MARTAEYIPHLQLDDVFVTGILARVIGANHVVLRNYRRVSLKYNTLRDIINSENCSYSKCAPLHIRKLRFCPPPNLCTQILLPLQ